MDILSIFVGGLLGGVAGWAFATATAKRHDAHRQYLEAIKAKRQLVEIEEKAKSYRETGFAETMQGYLLYSFGLLITVAFLVMLL